jgi:hypothetical protein
VSSHEPHIDQSGVPDEELSNFERVLLRELASGEHKSFGARSQIACDFIRTVVERSVREHERRIGIRHRKA